jgi:PAS domain S-box-containing protein
MRSSQGEGLIDSRDPIGYKQVVLRLRWVTIIVTAYLILFGRGIDFPQPLPTSLILFYLLSNLIAYALPSAHFSRLHFFYLVLLFDTFMVSLGIYLTAQFNTDFYLVYFLIIIFASIARSFKLLMVNAVIICGIYSWFLWTRGLSMEDLGKGIILRIPFFFIMNLFYGFLIQSFEERTKRFKKELKEVEASEEKYRQIVESALDAVAILDEGNHIKFFNGRLLQLTQYTPEELTGMEFGQLMNGFDRKGYCANLNRDSGSQRESMAQEADILRKGGEMRRVEVSSAQVLLSTDEVHTIFYLKDVTDRNEMEERLIRSEKLRSLGEMAAGVAHDFNNVLGAILGRVQLMKLYFMKGKQQPDAQCDEAIHKGLDIIEQAALDGAHTIKKIQEFTRKKGDDFLFVPIDLNEIVDGTIELMKTKIKDEAEERGIPIKVETIKGALSSVMGNPVELREVLVNIFLNAIDAMPRGGTITFKTAMEDGYACIEVNDDGTGMPDIIRKRIFDPFFTTKGVQQSGLGLSISYGIIHRHHGEIQVESEEGVGTTIRIGLPVAQEDKERRENEDGERRPTTLHHSGY